MFELYVCCACLLLCMYCVAFVRNAERDREREGKKENKENGRTVVSVRICCAIL